jgi:FtsP/CotA-like multicopper oxidase with cupredoxin domain
VTLGPLLWGPSKARQWLTYSTGHGSVFDKSDAGKAEYEIQSILLNGTGDVTQFNNQTNTSAIPTPYTLVFDQQTSPRPKRYLLRLINTSIGSTFVFSIDNHLLTIVSADFVPIYPYINTSVLIGIGQRYNVIVEANPRANGTTQPTQNDGNYWIRTWLADKCGPGVNNTSETYMQTGILRYNGSSVAKPHSSPWDGISRNCSDETYTSLRPVVPWIVGDPINSVKSGAGVQHMSIVNGNSTSFPNFGNNTSFPNFPLARLAFRNVTGDTQKFHFNFTPLQVNFSEPILMHLKDGPPWNPFWQVYPEGRTGQENDWVSFSEPFFPPCPTVTNPLILRRCGWQSLPILKR